MTKQYWTAWTAHQCPHPISLARLNKVSEEKKAQLQIFNLLVRPAGNLNLHSCNSTPKAVIKPWTRNPKPWTDIEDKRYYGLGMDGMDALVIGSSRT